MDLNEINSDIEIEIPKDVPTLFKTRSQPKPANIPEDLRDKDIGEIFGNTILRRSEWYLKDNAEKFGRESEITSRRTKTVMEHF